MEYKINYDKLNCTELHAAHILKVINDGKAVKAYFQN